VVFEAETFLVIAKSGSPLDADISDLDAREVKGGMVQEDVPVSPFLTIVSVLTKRRRRTAEEFSGFESKFDGCTVVLEPLTKNTYVLIVANDPRVGKSSLPIARRIRF
jgi:Ras-related GTP-binding protein A/B